MCKIFADDTSLFSKVLDTNKFVTELNTDLEKISQWAYQWKMQFNPDPNKQANEVIAYRIPLLRLTIIILLCSNVIMFSSKAFGSCLRFKS